MIKLINKNNIKQSYTNKLFPKFSTASSFYFLCCFVFLQLSYNFSFSQSIVSDTTKSIPVPNRMLKPQADSLLLPSDSTLVKNDTTSNALEAIVEYHSLDSIRFDLRNKKVFMFNEAEINYQSINLKAADIKIDFEENLLFAEGITDTAGVLIGRPIFKENEQEYKSKFMKYNYKTKRAFIKEVFTEDGEGFLHGKTIKKLGDESINVQHGSFTTCSNEDHPHFEFQYKKSKVIPGDKIITGPAHLVIEGVHTPLFIPFGLFPNKKGQRSGFIIPTYGESANRGFYFEDGGYYWALNENMDLKLTGDIYTYGSWALKAFSNYKKRYKYQGTFNLTYAINKEQDSDAARKDFAVRWQHAQDAKARPNSRFTANVNIVSSKYNTYNPTSTTDYLSSTFQSSISYQTKIAGKHQLTLNASHSQNTRTQMVNITLPQISFSVNRFYPFRKKNKMGNLKWYDNITVNYTMNAKNSISIADSLLFKPGFERKMKNGINQNIPISLPIKLLKHLNLNTSINIQDRIYFSSIRKRLLGSINEKGESVPELVNDTTYGANNVFTYNLTSSLTTRLYGMFSFKKGPIRAIRHVFSPSVSFSYTPDFSSDKWGYYDEVHTDLGQTESLKYSIFEGQIYGLPSNRKSARMSISFTNNLEMKVRSKKDTINGTKKVVLIENLSISTGYDFNDSTKWEPISISGRTTLFKNLQVNYSSRWNPYAVDEYGNIVNEFEWEFNKKLLRRESTNWKFGLNFNFSSKEKKNDQVEQKEKQEDEIKPFGEDLMHEYNEIMNNPDDYVDWNIPWKLRVGYNYSRSVNLSYTRIIDGDIEYYDIDKNVKRVHTMDFSGEVNITPKTRIGFRSGYDFENKKVSFTSLNIYRDLHCWEMRFNWIPIGVRKSWNFTIAIKSTLLQDLKLEKKKDFRDR